MLKNKSTQTLKNKMAQTSLFSLIVLFKTQFKVDEIYSHNKTILAFHAKDSEMLLSL